MAQEPFGAADRSARAGDLELSRDCRQIDHLAELIYRWDVAPVERATKAQCVRELYESGMLVTHIAAQLKTSKERVLAILADRDRE